MPVKQPPNLDLQRERFKQQMTRSTLSRQTGVSRKTLLDIEQRRVRPRLETASRIAKALDVEVVDLFGEAEVIG